MIFCIVIAIASSQFIFLVGPSRMVEVERRSDKKKMEERDTTCKKGIVNKGTGYLYQSLA